MGLILPQIVKVCVSSNTCKYYTDLNYQIPTHINKYGDKVFELGAEFDVYVLDLKKDSKKDVLVYCDNCKNVLKIQYFSYTKYNKDGKYFCKKCAMKLFNSGKDNPRWNDNLTDEERYYKRNRKDNLYYNDFVQRILKRDNYTCQCCNKKINGDGIVHHIDSWNICKDKRFDETNCISLCDKCHKNFHYIYGYGNNTKKQFEKWIGNTVNLLECDNYELQTSRKIYSFEEKIVYNSVNEYMKKYKIKNSSNIYMVCNNYKNNTNNWSVYGNHLFWNDEFEQMTEYDLEKYFLLETISNKHNKSVICITTGILFYKLKDAANKYNAYNIGNACKSPLKKSSGKLNNGTHLSWIYYNDYQSLSLEKKKEILIKNYKTFEKNSFLYNEYKSLIEKSA